MIKQFLIKNWLWVVFIGIMAFLYLEKSRESSSKDKIIETVIREYDEKKSGLDIVLDSLESTLEQQKKRAEETNEKYKGIEEILETLRNERTKINIDVPSYNDTKLDSILTNYGAQ